MNGYIINSFNFKTCDPYGNQKAAIVDNVPVPTAPSSDQSLGGQVYFISPRY